MRVLLSPLRHKIQVYSIPLKFCQLFQIGKVVALFHFEKFFPYPKIIVEIFQFEVKKIKTNVITRQSFNVPNAVEKVRICIWIIRRE